MALTTIFKNIVIYSQLTGGVLSPVTYLTDKDELEHPAPIVEDAKKLTYDMEATFYGPDCKGCSGITKVGYDVRNTIYVEGMRIIAADPKVIPLNSIVKVELEDGQVLRAVVGDIGGDIKNMRIDVLVSSEKESFKYGRQKAKLTILGKYE